MTSDTPRHVAVVGASLAGLRAVQAAREGGFTGRLTLVGEEIHAPYDRPPLSKEFLEPGPIPATPHLLDAVQLTESLDVDVRLGARATGLDLETRKLSLSNGEVGYDALLITTGARARQLPGAEGVAGVHCLRTLDDAIAIRQALERGARTVVIGGGFIGAEVASAARRRGLTPVILEALPTPLARAVGSDAGKALADLHARFGSELRCNTAVDRVVGDQHVEAVRLVDGTEIPADLVVVGIGATPSTDWLEPSSLTVEDGVVCDPYLQAGPAEWAAGDVARWINPLFDRAMRLEHWTNAGEQAVHAMANLLSPHEATPYTHVPYFWSDWYGQRIQFAGLPLGEPTVVTGEWSSDAFVALYREGHRLLGVLALNRRGDIMKYRGLIAQGASWDEALALANRRNAVAPVAV